MQGILYKLPFLLLFIIFPFLLVFETVHADKIIVLAFFSTKSHKITYMRLIEELAKRGHKVTVVTPIKATKEIHENIKEVFTFDVMNEVLSGNDPIKMKENNEFFNPLNMMDKFIKICDVSSKLPQVKGLLKENFDLVFIQPVFNECALGIAYKLKAPMVIFAPTTVADITTSKIAARLPPSFVPNILLDYTDEMTFEQRFINFGLTTVIELASMFYYEPVMEKIYRKELNDESIPSVREILGNASLILSNSHFSLSGTRPYLPDVIDVGGMHSRPPKPLPQDLEKFVSKKGSKGFIYFSMGSIINPDSVSKEKTQIFLRVFSKLKDYQIVWKWNKEIPNKPENVFLSDWLPQQCLLGHKNIKLFITHVGGGGLEESIYHGVPLVGIPIMGDQNMNAKQANRLGFLVPLDWNHLNEDDLMRSIKMVLNNPRFRNNVNRLSTIFKDQPSTPLERGVYWIEYVMRHKGAPHLRSAARKLYYFQYHSWDIIASYVLILLIILHIVKSAIKYCFRKVCSLFSSKGQEEKKKIN